MFRTIGISAKNQLNSLILRSTFCTNATTPAIRSIREINEVKLVGTLISDSYALKSGTTSLTVKTQDSPNRYSIHQVRLNTKANFVTGQRLYINGKLSSNRAKVSDGKTVNATSVYANKVFVLEDEHSGESNVNNVQIIANVASDVSRQEKCSIFNVATHFLTQKDNNMVKTDFHSVFAYDPNVREYVDNHLAKKDRVLITGRIGHMTYTREDGSKRFSGFIVAEGINKIARRLKNESTESGELQQEN